MKFKSLLLTTVVGFGLTTSIMAQVPNYVPTDGLVGNWQFNGNANDGSGNGNNGTVYGSSLTTDRFGNVNSAYYFDGIDDYVDCGTSTSLGASSTQPITISTWILPESTTEGIIVSKYYNLNAGNSNYFLSYSATDTKLRIAGTGQSGNSLDNHNLDFDQWIHVVCVLEAGTNNTKIYINGILTTEGTIIMNDDLVTTPFSIGRLEGTFPGYYKGKIDDIGVWNRVLTQEEITNLFTSCSKNLAITPPINSLAIGNTATFTATTSDTNPSYIWQSDFGQGFQTLNNFGNYSGVNTASMNISNVQLPNHTQPIRAISTSGDCIDTSNVSIINVLDTCIVTVNDTITTNTTIYDTVEVYISVTDTLIINTVLSGISSPDNLNTLKVYPNPANDHITIDYGNYSAMNNYTLKIISSIGQTVFTTPINQQTSYIDLSTWTGNGIYHVQLIDQQDNIVENRKIVIQ
jgi:hypothetical protein